MYQWSAVPASYFHAVGFVVMPSMNDSSMAGSICLNAQLYYHTQHRGDGKDNDADFCTYSVSIHSTRYVLCRFYRNSKL